MDKIREFRTFILAKGEESIYRRILRAALLGSFLTFFIMALIFLGGMFILQSVTAKNGENLSANVGDYLEDTIEAELKHHLKETTALKSRYVGRLLKGCAVNVELLANKMSAVLQNKQNHVPKELPIANLKEIPDNTPYIYYNPDLMKNGISDSLRQEILYASSISNDIERISRKYYNCVFVGSENGYMLRMDMQEDDDIGAFLSYEPLRSTYNHLKRGWYTRTKEKNRLAYIEPYIGSFGRSCVSICAPYYNGESFAGVVGVDIESKYIYERLKRSDTEGAEYTFIMSENGEIVFSSKKDGIFAENVDIDLRESENKTIADLAKNMTEHKSGISLIKIDGEEYYLAYMPIEDIDWSIGSLTDRKIITNSSDRIESYTMGLINGYYEDLEKFFIVMALVAAGLFVIVLYFIIKANKKMAQNLASPIKLLTEGVSEIAKGNLNKELSIKTGDELETLANNFNSMTKELSLYMKNLAESTAKSERIETELSVATRIQVGMLPCGDNTFPERDDFDLAALMRPAREVGGDFYDFYLMDEEHLVITIADVSDKGVPAALFMVIAKTILKETILYDKDSENLGKVFETANITLANSNEANMFVTVFTGILNTKTGEFIYVNAGHNPPIIMSEGKCSYIRRAENPIIGVIEHLNFKTSKLNLKHGDSIFLYTDGVTEARNTDEEFFGEERLLNVVQKLSETAESDIRVVYDAVKDYANGAVQSDDITLLELKFT